MKAKKTAQKIKTPPYKIILSFLLAVIILCIVFWIGNEIYQIQTRANAISWVDNDRSLTNQSAWFKQHEYSDCSDTALNYWPTDEVDCIFDEPDTGPRADDQLVAQDPPGLYYKHFLPTDFYSEVPTLLFNIDYTSLTQQDLSITLRDAVQQDPQAFRNVSVDSFYVGLEGGNTGTMVRSASLMVHPDLERPISNVIGVLQRAQILYKPFIEGAAGATISDADLIDLYTAALNRCGANAINGDQSGHGVYKIVGDYAVIVQNWNDPTDLDLSQTNDCNIHVVKLTPSINPPQPTSITPTFECLGTSCVPSPSPTISVIPTTSTITIAPSVSVAPSIAISPSIAPSITPIPPSSNTGGFLQFLLDILRQILNFFAQLFR